MAKRKQKKTNNDLQNTTQKTKDGTQLSVMIKLALCHTK